MNVRNAIFFCEYATCYWLIKQNKKKQHRHVAYFLSLNLFCKKNNIKTKNRLNLEKKTTQCNYRNKQPITLKGILHRNL